MNIHPVQLELFHNRFRSIAQEMGVVLHRTAFSPNIKERRDFSCGIFGGEGELIAQAAHIPVHLGSMPMSVAQAIAATTMEEGDMVLLNDPYAGGTHLPDITVIAPVYGSCDSSPLFYVASRAHHADVGGSTPGSMPLARSIYEEGLIIPPVHIMVRGAVQKDMMQLICKNVRTPREREGDFEAQFMACYTGIRRLQELLQAHGEEVLRYSRALKDYSEALLRQALKAIPDGIYEFSDYMEDDGLGTLDIPIHLKLTISDDEATLDFRNSGHEVTGSINAVRAITLSAVLYCFRCLLPPDAPTNEGLLRPLALLTRPGSILDAQPPRAVAGGNVETSQRVVDVVLGALAQAIPQTIPAASQGTMNNVAIGGVDPRRGEPFTYYETLGGGMGASLDQDGAGGIHSHMTNTWNTPVEALENAYPFLVEEYALRMGSGGQGAREGGPGLIRQIRLLSSGEVTILSERRRRSPYGLAGGEEGKPGRNLLFQNGVWKECPGKCTFDLQAGDSLRIETPGGGGYGYRKDEG